MALLTDATVVTRLAAKTRFDGCWIFTGGLTKKGYGQIWDGAKNNLAHRISYRHFNGPLCKNRVVDHECEDKRCWNPDHLVQVTNRKNVFPESVEGICVAGLHEMTPENSQPLRGGVMCKACAADRQRERRGSS